MNYVVATGMVHRWREGTYPGLRFGLCGVWLTVARTPDPSGWGTAGQSMVTNMEVTCKVCLRIIDQRGIW